MGFWGERGSRDSQGKEDERGRIPLVARNFFREPLRREGVGIKLLKGKKPS